MRGGEEGREEGGGKGNEGEGGRGRGDEEAVASPHQSSPARQFRADMRDVHVSDSDIYTRMTYALLGLGRSRHVTRLVADVGIGEPAMAGGM